MYCKHKFDNPNLSRDQWDCEKGECASYVAGECSDWWIGASHANNENYQLKKKRKELEEEAEELMS